MLANYVHWVERGGGTGINWLLFGYLGLMMLITMIIVHMVYDMYVIPADTYYQQSMDTLHKQ